MSYTVFVTALDLAPTGLQRLRQAGCRVLLMDDIHDPAEVERTMAAHAIDAVISRTVTLSARAIDGCPTLKVVSKHGVGVSNIDVDACTRRHIPVYVTPGANAQSVAEMSLALMLCAARKLAFMDSEIRAGRWTRAQDGLQLAGRVIGLVGFGQIGQRVARFCLALGMEVKAYDPAVGTRNPMAGVEMVGSLETLMACADVISLHVPLTPATRGLIDAERLALMPKDAILVNTARGEVVDEDAMIAALASGRLFAAGLDTMAAEPLALDSPLRRLPNVVLAPHVGGSTNAALSAMASAAAENVLGFLERRPVDPSLCVNPEVLQPASRAQSQM